MKVIINFLKTLIKYINVFELRQNQTCAITDTKQTVNPNKPRYAEEDNVVYNFNMNDMQFIDYYDEQNGCDLYKLPHTFFFFF